MQPKKVLVATRADLLPVAHCLYPKPEFSFDFCSNLDDAVKSLDQDIDLIACGVHFGDGQLYDFLRIAKSHPKARNVPFIVVDSGKEALYPYIQQSVEIASKALGAAAVLPITTWRQNLGDEAAFETYRKAIRKLLLD